MLFRALFHLDRLREKGPWVTEFAFPWMQGLSFGPAVVNEVLPVPSDNIK